MHIRGEKVSAEREAIGRDAVKESGQHQTSQHREETSEAINKPNCHCCSLREEAETG